MAITSRSTIAPRTLDRVTCKSCGLRGRPYPEISKGQETERAEVERDVCQLKVTLRGTRPPIWRRLLVPADMTLTRLHRVLQIAMGWQDSHMHEFRVEARHQAGLRSPQMQR